MLSQTKVALSNYLTGEYSRDCCPEYLSRDGFHQLKNGLVNRVDYFTGTLLDSLRDGQGTYTRFVLLDHMDWLSNDAADLLAAEWDEIFSHAAPGARVIWRSAGFDAGFLHNLPCGSTKGYTLHSAKPRSSPA